ncbi:F-box domain protein [Ceratocystis lukuohia]|uniref:F-box domain protein n=2 Tax=Ceratocystis TaxID=5157 RepID=A0A0F8CUR7_CERFI|nr:F-box domain protein [Ceratocystis platani]
MTMDPPSMSEFASDRFFSKLQEHETQNAASSTAVIPTSSTFILPVRDGRNIDGAPTFAVDSKQKARFGSTLRSKLLKTHSGSESDFVNYSARNDYSRRRSIQPLDILFRNLPVELQLQIFELLPFSDIINLRLVSRSWHEMISANQIALARFHLKQDIPAYALRLYPVPNSPDDWFYHMCALWSRLHIAAKMAHLTCEWVMTEIFLRRTPCQRAEFASQRERMRRRLIPLMLTIFHFFESYRQLHLEFIQNNPGYGLRFEPYTVNPIEAKIMATYDNYTLLRVHEVFPVVISTFCRQLRPPTYVGTIERNIRGYLKDKLSDEMTAAILCIGGPYQMIRFWEIIGYNHRRNAVDHWFDDLMVDRRRLMQIPSNGAGPINSQIPPPMPQAPTKSKHRLFGRLGLKKSNATFRETAKYVEHAPPVPTVSPSFQITGGPSHQHEYNPLAPENDPLLRGRPMAPLPPQYVRQLLPDMPVLQQIWMVTAEALIMERRIVERPQDIKRNGHVLFDLIREPTMADEDEIWYGRETLDSMQPLVKQMDEMDIDSPMM